MSHSLIPPLPACGEDSALHFTANNPRELHCFFAELHFHFHRSQISDDAEKKYHVLCYIDYESADLWEVLPEFSDPNQTFDKFAAAVYSLYPECDEERCGCAGSTSLFGCSSHLPYVDTSHMI